MSLFIPFEIPQDCNTYTKVRIYASTEEFGTYIQVMEVNVADVHGGVTYNGDDAYIWFRVSFIGSACGTEPGQESGLSTPIKGTTQCGGIYNNRISARLCQTVELKTRFYHGGRLADPLAIRAVKIYKRSVEEANLELEIPVVMPTDPTYPSPLIKDPSSPGIYSLLLEIPNTFEAPAIYFDVWCFISDECIINSSDFDYNSEDYWQCQCNKFWVYPDAWYVDDQLIVPRLSFEPLDVKFRAGEKRWMEVGLMPLPLYDYDYNLITPMIPYLCPTITITTRNNETIIDGEQMEIGLRQGMYRSNPYVVKYLLDTSRFIKGTYNYQITLTLPDGQVIVSPEYTFTIA